jgi:hypothetical protein
MSNNLTGTTVSGTYGRLVQVVGGLYYDGNGNLLNLGGTTSIGPQGPTGADGLQGPQGPTGVDGLQGPQGLTGADGANGSFNGDVATFSSITATNSSFINVYTNTITASGGFQTNWAYGSFAAASGIYDEYKALTFYNAGDGISVAPTQTTEISVSLPSGIFMKSNTDTLGEPANTKTSQLSIQGDIAQLASSFEGIGNAVTVFPTYTDFGKEIKVPKVLFGDNLNLIYNASQSENVSFRFPLKSTGTYSLATTEDLPTKTSDLINDGDNGTSHFISLEDLPSTLTLYPTTATSSIGGYNKLVSSITDPSYNTTAVDVTTGAITGTDQLIAGLITEPNQIVGNPGIFNMTTIGNIRKTSGSGAAEFFFRVYKRDAGGTETLILQSDNTQPIDSAIYVEFNASGLWNDGVFISTDRIVIKFYGTKVGGGSNPTYDFQFGGTSPIRSIVPVPLNVLPVISLDGLSDVVITGATAGQVLQYNGTNWINSSSIQSQIDGLVELNFLRQNVAYIQPQGLVNIQAAFNVSPNISAWALVLQGATNVNGLGGFVRFNTTAIAGTLAFRRGSFGIILGGYQFEYTQKVRFETNLTGQRGLWGLSAGYTYATPTNVEPNTNVNVVGVCQLSTSTNLHILHNDGTGIATTSDLGANYPCNTNIYTYYIKIKRTTSDYTITVERLTNSDNSTISTIYTTSTDIPAIGLGSFSPINYITNNAQSATASYFDGGCIAKITHQ